MIETAFFPAISVSDIWVLSLAKKTWVTWCFLICFGHRRWDIWIRKHGDLWGAHLSGCDQHHLRSASGRRVLPWILFWKLFFRGSVCSEKSNHIYRYLSIYTYIYIYMYVHIWKFPMISLFLGDTLHEPSPGDARGFCAPGQRRSRRLSYAALCQSQVDQTENCWESWNKSAEKFRVRNRTPHSYIQNTLRTECRSSDFFGDFLGHVRWIDWHPDFEPSKRPCPHQRMVHGYPILGDQDHKWYSYSKTTSIKPVEVS